MKHEIDFFYPDPRKFFPIGTSVVMIPVGLIGLLAAMSAASGLGVIIFSVITILGLLNVLMMFTHIGTKMDEPEWEAWQQYRQLDEDKQTELNLKPSDLVYDGYTNNASQLRYTIAQLLATQHERERYEKTLTGKPLALETAESLLEREKSAIDFYKQS